MVYPFIFCWKEEIKLIYDPKEKNFKNNEGVEIRPIYTGK